MLDPWTTANGPGGAFPTVYLCCGGSITFRWFGRHNVQILPTAEAFESCDLAASFPEVPATLTGRSFTVMPPRVNEMVRGGGAAGRCA